MRPTLLQVGLGPLGRRVAADAGARELGRFVAAVDCDPELIGRSLAELILGAPDVPVRSSTQEVDLSEVRCAIVTTSSDLELCMDDFRLLLDAGVAVVSTCEELSWPWLRHPVLAQELQERAVRGDGRIVGTGVNPGFLMDALPVALSTACRSVRAARVERVQDASQRRIPFQRKIGAGLSPAEFAERAAAKSLRHVGLGESLHFLAHHLGLRLEAWDEELEPVLAEREHECGLGPIPAGHARGVRQVARGTVDGETVCELVFQAAIDEPDPRDRIVLDAEPPLDMTLAGGVHGDVATSAVVLNTIPALLASERGLHTMADLPLRGPARP